MSLWYALRRVAWRWVLPWACVIGALWLWSLPWRISGIDITDGRHDRGTNGVWLQHGWLADDDWFERNGKRDRMASFRSAEGLQALAQLLRRHHITDLFPHLCPTRRDGAVVGSDPAQVERFLDAFGGTRVLPWIGGARGKQAFPEEATWRSTFVQSAVELLLAHPRLAGLHVNIEPCTSGDGDFLLLLDELRRAMPAEKLLSVAAYPPPTPLHPYPLVHWDQAYYADVSHRVDQLAVMMYDSALRDPAEYQSLMATWTGQCLAWSGRVEVLLGVPTYDDAGAVYHDPATENLEHALKGIHAGLSRRKRAATGYRGVAIYCEWETDADEWRRFRDHFLRLSAREKE